MLGCVGDGMSRATTAGISAGYVMTFHSGQVPREEPKYRLSKKLIARIIYLIHPIFHAQLPPGLDLVIPVQTGD
jgi:hypothetical protein